MKSMCFAFLQMMKKREIKVGHVVNRSSPGIGWRVGVEELIGHLRGVPGHGHQRAQTCGWRRKVSRSFKHLYFNPQFCGLHLSPVVPSKMSTSCLQAGTLISHPG